MKTTDSASPERSKSLTQEARRALSDRAMLDAATRLIARQGYAETTLSQIGEEAGYSRGLPGYRFGTKIELIKALVGDILERLGNEFMGPALEGKVGLEAILTRTDVFFEAIQEEPEVTRVYMMLLGDSLGALEEIRPTFLAAAEAYNQWLHESMQQGQVEGSIRADVDVTSQAALIGGLLRGISQQWLLDPGALDLLAVRKEVRRSLDSSLSANHVLDPRTV